MPGSSTGFRRRLTLTRTGRWTPAPCLDEALANPFSGLGGGCMAAEVESPGQGRLGELEADSDQQFAMASVAMTGDMGMFAPEQMPTLAHVQENGAGFAGGALGGQGQAVGGKVPGAGGDISCSHEQMHVSADDLRDVSGRRQPEDADAKAYLPIMLPNMMPF